jgi:leucyl-tRNA synthetase
MPRYNPAQIEPKWQRYWDERQTFAVPRVPTGEKRYFLDMFPYPSGDGLHVGHPEGYTATDIVSRFERMRGRTVLHPMGFDAFGLPAEEAAITRGIPPRVSTERNIANFTRQLKMLGFSYDWQRVLATTDPEYFRWTQWIFLVLFDTWFDPEHVWTDSAGRNVKGKGRPIAELPIPPDVRASGDDAVRRYQDEHRLAFISEAPVNWCPALGTVLANEEVVGGLSERGNHPVVRIPLKQWMLRITAYADRLENDLELVDWPASIKKLQKDWIGRSTGAEVLFELASSARWGHRIGSVKVFTTRPDTLFGATYMVLSPEHELVNLITTPNQFPAVEAYQQEAARKSDLERTDLAKTKTGVFTGTYAINPVNQKQIPIWIADYVLATYGTGAIMAVPAHDERDFEFAKRFELPIQLVVRPPDQWLAQTKSDLNNLSEAYVGDGVAINSGQYDGLPTPEFKKRITAWLEETGRGESKVNYKLRDWLFSRQRFWGEPFPILHELDAKSNPTGVLRTVPADQLPVDLPELEDFKPHGRPEPPLEKAPHEWLYVTLDGKRYKRETNTMPQWAGSCWYYLRFIDNRNNERLIDPALEKAWMSVDLYVGGAEHAVLHLLYSRFWHKVLFDRGHVSTPEPFTRLVNQGMILGEMEFTGYRKDEGGYLSASEVRYDENNQPVNKATGAFVKAVRVPPDQVEKQGDVFVLTSNPKIRVDSRAYKMSKSRGNVVNPDLVVKEYGADSLRLYEMFMGPLEATKPWSMTGVNGVRGFLDRVWRMIVSEKNEALELNPAVQLIEATAEQYRMLHKTIAAVTQDIETLSFNTAIAKMMEFTNFFTKEERRPKVIMEQFVLLLSPFAPHLGEELWELLGHKKSLAYNRWPIADPQWLKEDTVEVPVQVNGKLRGRVVVSADADAAAIEAAARADERIADLLAGKSIAKVIVVPGKLVNFVVK